MSATNVREAIKSSNLYFRTATNGIFDEWHGHLWRKALQKERADQKHKIFDEFERVHLIIMNK